MIIPGPLKRLGNVYLEGPDWVWRFGPIEVEYHHYLGPGFWLFGHNCLPGPWSPWWLLWRLIRRRMQEE